MAARQGSQTDDPDGARIDAEVLSSHPGAAKSPWRRRSSVVVMALLAVLLANLAAHAALGSNANGTSVAGGHAASDAGTSAHQGESDLVALIHTRCPHVRRLGLGGADTLLLVEIAPCPSGLHRRSGASGSQDAASTRFARIVGVPSTADQTATWIEVRCLDIRCAAPEVLFSAADIPVAIIH